MIDIQKESKEHKRKEMGDGRKGQKQTFSNIKRFHNQGQELYRSTGVLKSGKNDLLCIWLNICTQYLVLLLCLMT